MWKPFVLFTQLLQVRLGLFCGNLSLNGGCSAAKAVSDRNLLRKAFLVATKDEPVQDRRTNTEKILSAGFDTKPSFRNVK